MALFKAFRGSFDYVVVAILLLAVVFPIFKVSQAGAAVLGSRFIQMSSSGQAATDVTYLVGFTIATTGTVGSIAIEFCSNTPIIGDACTTPSGFNVNGGTLAIESENNIGALSVNGASDANTLILTVGTPASINSAVAVTFELGGSGGSDGVTNPNNTNTTFYARILTYVDADDDGDGCSPADDSAVCYASAAPGIYVDEGGIALSTTARITITAKVQERLTFCVYTAADCISGGTSVALGDTNGVLDPAGPYVDVTTKYDVATNAASGAAIRVKGPTLTASAATIDAMTTEAASTPGSEQFGMCTYQNTGTGLTPDTDYDGVNGGDNCSDTTQTAGTGSTGGDGNAFFYYDPSVADTTYGDIFANKAAGNISQGVIAFIGNVSFTTEAGIYNTTLTFIATGTY